MSISVLPIRLANLRFERPVRKHRAVDEVARLKHKLAGAELLLAGYRVQLDDADRALATIRGYQAEAEELVVQLQADKDDLTLERDQLAEELLALRLKFGPELAAEANANAIRVPPMIRDTSALEDQATGPIDVTTLWAARDAGLLGPVLDPGHP